MKRTSVVTEGSECAGRAVDARKREPWMSIAEKVAANTEAALETSRRKSITPREAATGIARERIVLLNKTRLCAKPNMAFLKFMPITRPSLKIDISRTDSALRMSLCIQGIVPNVA